jgi:hypothetical protein
MHVLLRYLNEKLIDTAQQSKGYIKTSPVKYSKLADVEHMVSRI